MQYSYDISKSNPADDPGLGNKSAAKAYAELHDHRLYSSEDPNILVLRMHGKNDRRAVLRRRRYTTDAVEHAGRSHHKLLVVAAVTELLSETVISKRIEFVCGRKVGRPTTAGLELGSIKSVMEEHVKPSLRAEPELKKARYTIPAADIERTRCKLLMLEIDARRLARQCLITKSLV